MEVGGSIASASAASPRAPSSVPCRDHFFLRRASLFVGSWSRRRPDAHVPCLTILYHFQIMGMLGRGGVKQQHQLATQGSIFHDLMKL